MSYGFTFRGVHSSAYGVYVRTDESYILPPRNQTSVSIPGRPGSLVFNGEPNNKTISLLLTTAGNLKTRRNTSRAIAGWLSGSGSLVMDYEPDMRYEVVSIVNNTAVDMSGVLDTFTASFECEPYQYGLKRGYTGTYIDAEHNGTAPADTIITISGAGDVAASCAGSGFMLSGLSGTVILDSRRMAVYTPSGQAMTHLHTGGFIRIPPGGAALELSGDITSANAEYWEMWL